MAMSILLIVISFITFTKLVTPKRFLKIFYDCLLIKAICWSPFIANEYFDTLFEHIYLDVQFQLNPIRPASSRNAVKKSPLQRISEEVDVD
jgi:hypothetical protein